MLFKKQFPVQFDVHWYVYTPVPPLAWQEREKYSAALTSGPSAELTMDTLRSSAVVDVHNHGFKSDKHL